MTLRERQVVGVTILDIDGRITVQDGAAELRDALQQLIGHGHEQLVLNCQQVPYIDTTGIAAIVASYTSVIRRGGMLKLLHLTPHVRRILQITKLSSIFEVFTDEDAAIESFRPAQGRRAGGPDGL